MTETIDQHTCERVALHVNVRKLTLGGPTAADTFAVLYSEDDGSREFLGSSNIVKEENNPKYSTVFMAEYHFEVQQDFVVEIYQYDGCSPHTTTAGLKKHTSIGSVTFSLAHLMRSNAQKLSFPIKDGKISRIEVRGENMAYTRDNFSVKFSAHKLRHSSGFFSTPSPYLIIKRKDVSSEEYTEVWRNQPINANVSPGWEVVKIPMIVLCDADIEKPLRIEIRDSSSAKNELMGEIDTSVQDMLSREGAGMFVIDKAKQAKKRSSYVHSGLLSALEPTIDKNPLFMEYITGGTEISLVVGIDFTASNLDPSMSASLHYIDPTGETQNPYERAILSVGDVLQEYDSDQKYPVYGFGAKIKQADGSWSTCQHCFPLHEGGAEVEGIGGVLQAYRKALSVVNLSGPTLFGPLVTATANMVREQSPCAQEAQQYTILLIITDGVINDLDKTKAAIIEASYLPLSIIIIGVGEANFGPMVELDSDNQLLELDGKRAQRDIVQFVNFNEVVAVGSHALQEAVLSEIPGQFLLYMKQHGIVPNAPTDNTDIAAADVVDGETECGGGAAAAGFHVFDSATSLATADASTVKDS